MQKDVPPFRFIVHCMVASQSGGLLSKATAFNFATPLFLKLIGPQNLTFLIPLLFNSCKYLTVAGSGTSL